MLGQEQDSLGGGGLVSRESTSGVKCLQQMKSMCCPSLVKPRRPETCTSGKTSYTH